MDELCQLAVLPVHKAACLWPFSKTLTSSRTYLHHVGCSNCLCLSLWRGCTAETINALHEGAAKMHHERSHHRSTAPTAPRTVVSRSLLVSIHRENSFLVLPSWRLVSRDDGVHQRLELARQAQLSSASRQVLAGEPSRYTCSALLRTPSSQRELQLPAGCCA